MIKLFNTLSKNVEVFKPIDEVVKIYCCGVTVYDLCHLGHARSYIAWDVLRRFLIYRNYKVKFVQNFTDIDDKILKRAREENCSMQEVSQKNIIEFHKDMDALGIMRPDSMPTVTNSILSIVELIKNLESKGYAYSVDGDVYYSVLKNKNYGQLSNQNIQEQNVNQQGRISVTEKSKKESPQDFALWKNAKANEPSFNSPWGQGRPGWHIECSAMVKDELGETIDIHLGGSDLIFPHHENEIAQSESANNKKLANYWLHNGMVNVNGQKMSKSLKNFTTIRDLLESGTSPMALRYFVLTVNYRKPLDFTDEALKSASEAWKNINVALSFFDITKKENLSIEVNETNEFVEETYKDMINYEISQKKIKFTNALNSDLNTAGAIAIIYELAKPLKNFINQSQRIKNLEINTNEKFHLRETLKTLEELTEVLGLKKEAIMIENKINEDQIQSLINKRLLAKKEKDYAEADKIRNSLKEKGVELIDQSPELTTWVRI
ncbi:cysteine--tRNA ligase [Prochlorococcus sp. AH-716-N03]|nr:cysteine--tRNA ligase [Prochlorococcus sp. AH-716-N03]